MHLNNTNTEYSLNPSCDITVLKRLAEGRKVCRWVQERETGRNLNPQVKEVFLYILSFVSIISFPYTQLYPSQNSKSVSNRIFFIIHCQSIVFWLYERSFKENQEWVISKPSNWGKKEELREKVKWSIYLDKLYLS